MCYVYLLWVRKVATNTGVIALGNIPRSNMSHDGVPFSEKSTPTICFVHFPKGITRGACNAERKWRMMSRREMPFLNLVGTHAIQKLDSAEIGSFQAKLRRNQLQLIVSC